MRPPIFLHCPQARPCTHARPLLQTMRCLACMAGCVSYTGRSCSLNRMAAMPARALSYLQVVHVNNVNFLPNNSSCRAAVHGSRQHTLAGDAWAPGAVAGPQRCRLMWRAQPGLGDWGARDAAMPHATHARTCTCCWQAAGPTRRRCTCTAGLT